MNFWIDRQLKPLPLKLWLKGALCGRISEGIPREGPKAIPEKKNNENKSWENFYNIP